jgi:hypothetical protein
MNDYDHIEQQFAAEWAYGVLSAYCAPVGLWLDTRPDSIRIDSVRERKAVEDAVAYLKHRGLIEVDQNRPDFVRFKNGV